MHDIADLMEGARNCVRGHTVIQPGERVLIWTDRSGEVSPTVIDALTVAVEEVGAEATIVTARTAVHRRKERLAEPLVGALARADVVLSVLKLENAATIHSDQLQELLVNTPLRCTAVIAVTPELMASEWARYPTELIWAIHQKVRQQALSANDDRFHLTAENGTDLTGQLDFQLGFRDVRPPKKWSFFPPGDVAELPRGANGTLVFEQLEGFEGLLRDPIRLTIRDQWVVDVEGGIEARWFRALMDVDKGGRFFCEVAIGVHPKAPLGRGLHTRAMDTLTHRHAGTFHGGVGKWGLRPPVPSKVHWDGGILRPTFDIGKIRLVDHGHLVALDDPEIRDLASTFGDPDLLLTNAL